MSIGIATQPGQFAAAAAAGGGSGSLDYITNGSGAGSGITTMSMTGVSFGADVANREIILAICTGSGGGGRSITGGTIGGQAITIDREEIDVVNRSSVALVRAAPSGTSGDISITVNLGLTNWAIGVFRVVGNVALASSFYDFSSTSPVSATLNVPANAAVIGACSVNYTDTTTHGWSGLTERYELYLSGATYAVHSGASDYFASANASLGVDVTKETSRDSHVLMGVYSLT